MKKGIFLISLIVSGVLGLVWLVMVFIQYLNYQEVTPEEKQRIQNTVYEMFQRGEAKKAAQGFINRIVPEILKSWNVDKYLASMDKRHMTPQQEMAARYSFSNLEGIYGPMIRYVGSEEDLLDLRGTSLADAYLRATFLVKGVFKNKGAVQFKVSASKEPGVVDWHLEGFHGL
jgi:hypothetical protein